WGGWVAVAAVLAVLLASGALLLALQNRRALRGRGIPIPPAIGAAGSRGTAATADADAAHVRVAFVANPTKPGVPELRDAAVQACAARYLPEPMWFETTAEDPGIGQTREAVARGAQ